MKYVIIILGSLLVTYFIHKDFEKQAPINRARMEGKLDDFKSNGLEWCLAEFALSNPVIGEKHMILKIAISHLKDGIITDNG